MVHSWIVVVSQFASFMLHFKKTSLSNNASDMHALWDAQASHFPRTRVLQVLNWPMRTEHVQTLAVELYIPSSGTVFTGGSRELS